MLIKIGAEAQLRLITWKGRRAVEKYRIPKAYRLAQLDERLRSSRIRTEVKLMTEARSFGISVPIVYDVDVVENKIIMEHVDGKQAKEVINSGVEASDLCRRIGSITGTLHSNGIVHGDLTTSNMLVSNGDVYLIDFSLGRKSREIENQGVDLHLLKEAFSSAHSERFHLFRNVLSGYRENYERAEEVVERMAAIERRGRYT
ncbi:MAG: KEOPS complex kinase/ATPase Bud32 [Thermoplasmata archaeon]